ncbi:hypothetical protein IPG41_03325 [Candidatus Peregrinibacteria bacterium]|nr:MAG: hypothetical protein IPG41_03325 [Candidatus Peregrinibacteria bacterium]
MENPSLPNLQELVPTLKPAKGYESLYAKQNPRLTVLGCFEWDDASVKLAVSKLKDWGYTAITEPVGGIGKEQQDAKAFFILV